MDKLLARARQKLSKPRDLLYAALVFAAVTWPLPTILWVHDRFFDPHDDYADQGITGPYEAVPVTSPSGAITYEAGAELTYIEPGRRFAWVSSVCLEEGASMIGHVELKRLADKVVVYSSTARTFRPADKRCGAAVGSMVLPADAAFGKYDLERLGIVRPYTAFPLNAPLTSLRVTVASGTTPPP